MNRYIIDTSVVVAWYLTEEFSLQARRWQKDLLAGRIELFVPELHYLELGNVLRTYVRRGELESDIALEIFDTHLMAPLKTAEINRSEILSISLEYDSIAYDAVYICLAKSLGAPLITAERTTTPWVVKLGDLAQRV